MGDNRILAAILYAAWNANKPSEARLNLDQDHFLEEFFKFEKKLAARREMKEQ